MGKMRNVNNILVRKPVAKNDSENLVVDGKVTLNWILGKLVGRIEPDAYKDRNQWRAVV